MPGRAADAQRSIGRWSSGAGSHDSLPALQQAAALNPTAPQTALQARPGPGQLASGWVHTWRRGLTGRGGRRQPVAGSTAVMAMVAAGQRLRNKQWPALAAERSEGLAARQAARCANSGGSRAGQALLVLPACNAGYLMNTQTNRCCKDTSATHGSTAGQWWGRGEYQWYHKGPGCLWFCGTDQSMNKLGHTARRRDR